MQNLSTLRNLGYQIALVWFEIQKTPSWDAAIDYVDALYEEADTAWSVTRDAEASGIVLEYAEMALDSALGGLTTEREIVRSLAQENDYDPRTLREYVQLRLAFENHPEWARILRRAGAMSYSGNPGRPYHWQWSKKDLAGLKVYLDYSWETFAGMFYYRGRPVSATMLNNPPTIWDNEYPDLLEKIIAARILQ